MVQHEILTKFNKLANNKKLTNNQLYRHIAYPFGLRNII